MPSWTGGRTSWRVDCGGWASVRRPGSECCWSARPRWSWRCSASSRPAAPTCRSIRPIRKSAGSGFSATRA